MTIKQKLEKLAAENSNPCVSISLNTHRTHPDNTHDAILLRKLINEAKERVIDEFGKRPVASLLEKLSTLEQEIDVYHNLDSLHIYLSNETTEIVKTTYPVHENAVYIADSFVLRPLIKAYNRSEEYLIMVLSQSGVNIYEALNENIISEISKHDFPFSENPHFETEAIRKSDPKHTDNLVKEFLNKVDKALVKVHNETGLSCVLVCTEDNYSRLMQVADKQNVYLGYVNIDYNKANPHQIIGPCYQIIKDLQEKRRIEAIEEMKEAVSKGKVLTDLQEIYRAAKDGRGELLIVHHAFSQPVIMRDAKSFDLTTDPGQPGTIDDITSVIAWNIMSKKGRVIFTKHEQIKDLGEILLKTRY